MDNIFIQVLGSELFRDLIHETKLPHVTILDDNYKEFSDSCTIIKIVFPENLTLTKVKEYLDSNEPSIFLLKDKNYLIKNKFILGKLQLSLELPVEILVLKEILNILITKYYFSINSNLIFNDYKLDLNQKTISKKNIKVKLTEKELKLILKLKEFGKLSKSSILQEVWNYKSLLNSHAFETHLHRLRKKILKAFDDSNFILEKNSFYYLNK